MDNSPPKKITISIIGTAGRKEDGVKMTKILFEKIVLKTLEYIQNLTEEKRISFWWSFLG